MAPAATAETALAVALVAFGLALGLIIVTHSVSPLVLVLLSGPLAGFLSVWVAATALPRLIRWAATIAVGAVLAVVFVTTLDGLTGVTLLAFAASVAAAISGRPAMLAAISVIWVELGLMVLFPD